MTRVAFPLLVAFGASVWGVACESSSPTVLEVVIRHEEPCALLAIDTVADTIRAEVVTYEVCPK